MNAQPSPHPTDRTLSAYGLGQLDDAAAGSVHTHLEGCPDCRRRVAEVTSDSFLGRLRDANARPDSGGPAVSATDGLSMLDGGAGSRQRPRPIPCRRGLPTTPTTRSFGNWDAAGWASSISREHPHGAQGGPQGRRRTTPQPTRHPRAFSREIRSAARLQHPNIVAAYSALRLGECFVLAMEYVEGIDLSRRRQGQGATAGRQRLQLHAPGGSGPATRARARHGPPRHQAGQPDPRSRRGPRE